MADNNEEQYLDELLSSLMNSNTEEDGADVSDRSSGIQEPSGGTEGTGNKTELNQDDINSLVSGMFDGEDSESQDGMNDGDGGGLDDIFALEEQEEDAQQGGNFSGSGLTEEYNGQAGTPINMDSLLGGAEDNEAGTPINMSTSMDMDALNAELLGGSQSDADEGLLDLLGEINKSIESEEEEAVGKKEGFFARLFGRKKASSEDDGAEQNGKKKKEKKNKKAKPAKKKNKNVKKDKEQEEAEDVQETEMDAASKENIDLINTVYSSTDSLDTVSVAEEEEEEEKPKKEKKKKKERPPKPPKPPKEPKPKKEKRPPRPSELVKVTPFTFLGIIIFTAVIVGAVMIGSGILTYNNSIASAKQAFENGKYDQAFDHISGIEVREKDKNIYYKIRAVMSIYSDYSSYVSYSKIGMMTEALDVLIQGLEHYDMYYADAEKYEVLPQYDEVKALIVATLASYGISEEDTVYYRQLESTEQYIEILQSIGGMRE